MKASTVARSTALAALIFSAHAHEKSTLSLTVENDSFIGNSDCYYTQGFRLQYMLKPNDLPTWTATALNGLPRLGLDIERRRIGFAVGQELFTPRRLSIATFQEKDRPYAGWLHGSFIARRAGQVADMIPAMDEFELDLGVVGPEALGEETQTWWHDLINEKEPKGWANQLKTEPALQLYWTRSVQFGCRTANYWGMDLVPHAKGALGNIYVYGEIGTLFRAGYNLPSEYVISPIESFSTHPSYAPPSFSTYVFAGADGRAVGHNLFLDGNSFREGPHVEKETFVSDMRVGGSVRYCAVEGVVSLVHRTKEFVLQRKDENFLSLTVQYHF